MYISKLYDIHTLNLSQVKQKRLECLNSKSANKLNVCNVFTE